MPRYCPMCGKPETQVQFIGEFCHSCARTRVQELPAVQITICSKCGSLIDKARKKKDAKLADEVIRLLKLKQKDAEFDEKSSQVTYDSALGRITQPVIVLTEKSQCVVCGRAGTQY